MSKYYSKYEPMLRTLQNMMLVADKDNQQVIAELTAYLIVQMNATRKLDNET